jgi:hypothetical protein
MRTLADLLASSEGRALLEGRRVFTSAEAFVERLEPPANDGLIRLLRLDPKALPVYAAHQIKADYPESVTAKLRTARELDRGYREVAGTLVWLDLDRAGADRLTTAIHLRGRSGTLRIRLSSRRHDDKEVRFVPVERSQLEEAVRKLGAWARQQGTQAAERQGRLGAALLGSVPTTLRDTNLAVTSFLLRDHLGWEAPSVLVSTLAGDGLLTGLIDEVVNRIDDVITVWGAAVESLAADDIDPQVRVLTTDYLPLHYSCDRDGRRCSLRHQRRGAEHLAITTCVCGAEYEFPLGTTSLSIAGLAATGRWSPDVTLPIYLNDLASGVVAGRSSALYGLVLNEVVEKVLGRPSIPILVPSELSAAQSDADTLLQEYLA